MPPATMTLLQLDPESTLTFQKTPTTTSPNRILKVTNPSSSNVAFKVKTTAPKSYLVRPSSGTLKPKETQDVQIILQPQGNDAAAANQHRFLVQAIEVASVEPVSREQWTEFSKNKGAIQEQRLSVIVEECAAAPQPEAIKETNVNTELTGLPSGDAANVSLKDKYDELVQYVLMLEKTKKKLEADLAAAQTGKNSLASTSGSFNIVHMVMVAIISVLLCYLGNFMR